MEETPVCSLALCGMRRMPLRLSGFLYWYGSDEPRGAEDIFPVSHRPRRVFWLRTMPRDMPFGSNTNDNSPSVTQKLLFFENVVKPPISISSIAESVFAFPPNPLVLDNLLFFSVLLPSAPFNDHRLIWFPRDTSDRKTPLLTIQFISVIIK